MPYVIPEREYPYEEGPLLGSSTKLNARPWPACSSSTLSFVGFDQPLLFAERQRRE